VLSFGSPLSVEFRYVGLSCDPVRTVLSVFYGYHVACTICTICLYYYSFYIKIYVLRCNPGSVSI